MTYYSNYSDLQQQQQLQQPTNFASLLASAASSNNNYNNPNNSANSPISYQTILNSQIQRTTSPIDVYNNNGNTNNTFANSSSASSASSVSSYKSLALSSPQSSVASLYSTHRARFMSSKGFEFDDDIEFCPDVISNYSSNKYNAYSAPIFTPNGSPTSSAANPVVSPFTPTDFVSPASSNLSNAAKSSSPTTPRAHTPRVRKALEIVNPHTGMRIGSSPQPPIHRATILQAAK